MFDVLGLEALSGGDGGGGGVLFLPFFNQKKFIN